MHAVVSGKNCRSRRPRAGLAERSGLAAWLWRLGVASTATALLVSPLAPGATAGAATDGDSAAGLTSTLVEDRGGLGVPANAGDDFLDPQAYRAAIEFQQEQFPWAYDIAGGEAAAQSTQWVHKLAFAMFSQGVGKGFDTWITAVFGNQTQDALAQLVVSMESIQADIQEIEEAIKRLEESVDRNAFITAEGWAKTYATHIAAQFKLIEGWTERGHSYDDGDVAAMVSITYTAVEQLRAHLTGNLGTKELLERLLSHGNHNAGFAELDNYRAGYRGHLSMALLNLEWAAEHDQRYLNQLEIAEATASATATELYDVGLDVEQMRPDRSSRIHLRHGGWQHIQHINNNFSPVAFDLDNETLPPTFSLASSLRIRQHINAYNYQTVDVHAVTLTANTFNGTVTGTLTGRINYYAESAPTWAWTFDSQVTGHIDSNGRLMLNIPVQNPVWVGQGSAQPAPHHHYELTLNR